MTIEQLQHKLAAAADDTTAPPTRVTVTEVYRIGLRRRRTRRWFSFAVATVAVAGATGGVTVAVTRVAGPDASAPEAGAPAPLAPLGSAAPATAAPATPEPTGGAGSCRALANEVTGVLEAALPGEIRWGRPELMDDADSADCGGGGLFWISFTYGGEQGRLGFEGGTGTGQDDACDPARRPVRCEPIEGGEVGHLDGEEYGVLLARGGTYFFLGLPGGAGDRPLTTDQLSAAAQRIAREVFA